MGGQPEQKQLESKFNGGGLTIHEETAKQVTHLMGLSSSLLPAQSPARPSATGVMRNRLYGVWITVACGALTPEGVSSREKK